MCEASESQGRGELGSLPGSPAGGGTLSWNVGGTAPSHTVGTSLPMAWGSRRACTGALGVASSSGPALPLSPGFLILPIC